ncbi:hypothetical protein J3Q64DRAFT_1643310 [Phycomyces blakesleeanus]|uniref:IPT/TIG domain-containing protein n=1 Tax=Phycomyces blakesleeanus TaxID=4837 RepID=A0ABR3ATV7_PHYBL
MQIRVLGVPQTGAKSRVETQIKLCIQLVTDDGDKAQWWSHLKLPEHMVAKDKLKRQVMMANAQNGLKVDGANLPIKPERMLFLSARVICASDPSRKVVTCLGCIQRERKRSQRRKENKIKTDNEDDNRSMEDDKSLALEEQKVLLFNCSEIVDFSSGDTILPTRITCYCRHHNERLGFCIYFEMHDQTGKQVATGMSPPIMITDDHKSNKIKAGRKRPRTDVESHTPLISSVPSMATQTHPTPMVTENTVQQTVIPTPILNDRPQLQRLIPNEGPTYGGIEVTILGSGFRPGLTCLFGDAAASSTHYWSPNTLVCILPPAVEPGTVVVSFKEYPMVMDSQDVTLFTYFNENDRALMELALQVVGLKMTGKVEDARAIAMRIVQGGNQNQQSSSGTSNQDNQQNQNQNQNQNQTCLERHIIQVLEVMDIMEDVDSVDVSLTSGQGHTMLHLAAILNFSKLTRTLIELGCNVDTMDRNGNTALHYAAMFGHEDLAKILLDDGKADSGIVNQWNKRPMHLSKDNTMRLILHTYMPVDADEVSDSCGASVSSDMLGADVDTSFSDESSYDDDVISLDGDRVDRNEINQRWLQFYQSDSSASAQSELYEEGLRNRRRPTLNIQSIQYLEDDGDLHSPDEIMDAEAVHNNHIDTSSDTDDDGDMSKADLKSTWMQRTLSHLQQEKDKHLSYVTDNTFVQNIKNNMPAKPTELNLKTIADHVLQFPRPTEMIANMSVMFSQDQAKGSSTDEPEQTLAWYMALAYSIGAGSRSLPEQPIRPLDQKQPEIMGPEAIADQKRRDRRLFSLWVPLLCCK